MKISPKGHFVLIKPDALEERDDLYKAAKAAGIVLNENTTARDFAATQTGKIVAIGPMAWKAFDRGDPDWRPWARVGERVFFQKYVSKQIIDEDSEQEFFLMADENILAGVK